MGHNDFLPFKRGEGLFKRIMILFSFLLPEASVVCGPVISLGSVPDHMIHLNAARPMLSFSHSQKVLFSKSQSPPLAMKKGTMKT